MYSFISKFDVRVTKRKQVKQAYELYRMGNRRTLYDCYKNPSYAKEMAYNMCRDFCWECDGKGDTVLAYNCQGFTFAFIGYLWGKKMFFYITKNRRYAMEI